MKSKSIVFLIKSVLFLIILLNVLIKTAHAQSGNTNIAIAQSGNASVSVDNRANVAQFNIRIGKHGRRRRNHQRYI